MPKRIEYRMIQDKATRYFERFETRQIRHDITLSDQTKIAVVIPAFNEPEIQKTLNCLWNIQMPTCSIVVMVVINFSEDSTELDKSFNISQTNALDQWFEKNSNDKIYGVVIGAFDLKAKDAGAGLARKIGMDNVLHAFAKKNIDGWIINLDADCKVSDNYFLEHEKSWMESRRGAICYFEHAMDQKGIVTYELYLRYYVQALKWAGFEFATHTIGSTFATRASVYPEIGGMNKRKAGEDFYFIQKLMSNGNVKQMVRATVFPSDRLSDRVPFGTGRAIENYHEFESIYNFKIFQVLKELFGFLKTLKRSDAGQLGNFIPTTLQKYFTDEYIDQIKEIQLNTSDQNAFTNRIRLWFNNFQVMKFIHELRDVHDFENQSIQMVCKQLLNEHGVEAEHTDLKSLLLQYRRLDKQWENT